MAPQSPVGSASSADPDDRSRRYVMRGMVALVVAAAAIPVVAASRPPGADDTVADPRDTPDTFEETYRGRLIRGTWAGTGRAADDAGEWQVTVDGRPLHLMRRADGTYLSMVDHYQSYATPLAAARAAVDELGPKEHLRAMGMSRDEGGRSADGGHRGVHA
ncbi:tyrosinase family oxidase copper chaperone [Streptomyces sp. R21]|uniref:Tyrosinase family oxidase copper chaperone n=1 Tax=Streptomyces sp. R21 TaxID=3238627 RepID=A0AB39PDD4_9ACTN